MSSILMPSPDPSIIARASIIIADLRGLVGHEQVISDLDGRRAYDTDGLTAYRQLPLAVTLPRTTGEVAKILRYAHENNVKVVPRGAGTSLCGGALPSEDAIVLCVAKMNRVLQVDYVNRTARLEVGITNLGISAAVAERGFFYAPDPSSQLACTLGGNLAMNSGGAHCLKYGVTTNNVLGVRMVLMDGEIIELGGEHVDAPGYDILSLIIGSEGQLGVITEATVRILAQAEGARPMLLGFSSPEAAGQCVSGIIAAGIIPVAMEYMDKPAIAVCEAFAKAGYPLDVEALLIVEVEGSPTEIEASLAKITDIARLYNPSVVRISDGPVQSAKIWKGRKSAFGAVGRISDYMCMDGTIPLKSLPDVLRKITQICDRYGLKVANIFHAGDGNLHPLILYDANNAEQMLAAEHAGAEILRLCVEVGGCLTGEHGVGIEKRDLMKVQFTDTDLAVQTRVRAAFEPLGLLNGGKVFPLEVKPHAGLARQVAAE